MRVLTSIAVASLLMSGCSNTPTAEVAVDYTPVIQENNTRDLMALGLGQSNMANSGLGDYIPSNGVFRIDSTYTAVLAQNPVTENVLADGIGSNMLTLLGDMMVEADKADSFTFANVAEGGSCIIQWTPEGEHFNKIREIAKQGYDFTHILFHQGECDTAEWENTSISDYKIRFIKMLKGIRELGINSPIYVARTSYGFGVVDPRIIQAQNELIEEYEDIHAGAYTDILGVEYRYDNAHFNEEGLIAHAKLWEELL